MFDKAVICLTFVVYSVSAEDFITKFEKFELVEYAKMVLSAPKIHFDPTTQTLNASIYLWTSLIDPGKTIQGTLEFFVKENDDYVPTGLRMRKNVCYLWNQKDNAIAAKLKKYGNINLCSIGKGDLFVQNFPLDDSLLPKSLNKPGQYKIVMKALLYSITEILTVNMDLRVTPKNV